MVYPKHIDKQTADGTAQNLEALYKLFPSCFTESADVLGNVQRAINWGKLRELLGDNIADGAPEVYDFNDIPMTTCCKFSLELHYQTEMKECSGIILCFPQKFLSLQRIN